MPEVKKEAKTYIIDYYCDVCATGKMEPTGQCLLTSPTLFTHICSSCGDKQNFKSVYPLIRKEYI